MVVFCNILLLGIFRIFWLWVENRWVIRWLLKIGKVFFWDFFIGICFNFLKVINGLVINFVNLFIIK